MSRSTTVRAVEISEVTGAEQHDQVDTATIFELEWAELARQGASQFHATGISLAGPPARAASI